MNSPRSWIYDKPSLSLNQYTLLCLVHTVFSFLLMLFYSDTDTLVGLPRPIHESVKTLKQVSMETFLFSNILVFFWKSKKKNWTYAWILNAKAFSPASNVLPIYWYSVSWLLYISVGFTSCYATYMHWRESSGLMHALLGLFQPLTVRYPPSVTMAILSLSPLLSQAQVCLHSGGPDQERGGAAAVSHDYGKWLNFAVRLHLLLVH